MAKLPAMWKPPAATGRGCHTVADAPEVVPDCAVRKKRGVNPGDLSQVDGQKFRRGAPGDQNAPKRG